MLVKLMFITIIICVSLLCNGIVNKFICFLHIWCINDKKIIVCMKICIKGFNKILFFLEIIKKKGHHGTEYIVFIDCLIKVILFTSLFSPNI